MLVKVLLTTAVVFVAILGGTTVNGQAAICPGGATCPDGAWVGPFDEDDPTRAAGDTKDEELLAPLVAAGRVCAAPIALKYATSVAGEVLDTCNHLIGLVCLNIQQPNLLCQDYRVWFCCPDFEPPAGQTTTLGPPLPPPPPCIIWIWIVIDVSSSISVDEFLSILQWLLEFIECFDGIDVQIGIITYECLPYMDVRIGTYQLDDPALVDAINGLERRGGRTRTGLALHYVKCMSDIPEDACGVVILVSDGSGANGQGTDDYIANAAMLRDSGFALYAVSVGNFVNTAALATITGDPDRVVDQSDHCGLATRILVYCCPVV